MNKQEKYKNDFEELRIIRMKKYNEKQKKENIQEKININNKLLHDLEECENKRKSINDKILFIDKKIKKLASLPVELQQPIINYEYNKYIEMFNDIIKKKIDEHNSNITLTYQINFKDSYIMHLYPGMMNANADQIIQRSSYQINNFEQNKYINEFFPIYYRFINAYNKSQHKELRVVYHGTSKNNIDNILRCGLDPKRRSSPYPAIGEYFSNFLDVSVGYTQRTNITVIIFIILMNPDGITFNTIPELVINKSEYQLPIGYITCNIKS